MKTENPLLQASGAPFGAPRFDLFHTEDYKSAFCEAIRTAKAEVESIASNPAAPDFDNTVAALEYAGMQLQFLEDIFFNLLEAESSPAMEDLAEEISPLLTEYSMSVLQNRILFERVKAVHDKAPALDPASDKLLKNTYLDFVRSGAALPDADKEAFSRCQEQLSLLELQFGKQSLSATNRFILHLEEEGQLDGLSRFTIDSAAEEAKERGLDGWVFTLQYPSYHPFMRESRNRPLREKLYRAYASRAVGGPDDNTGLIREIVSLRIRMAQLLGYRTYADYALERRMAGSPSAVLSFLDRLMGPSLPAARSEVADILSFARENGFAEEELQPWDFPYWSEQYRRHHYDLDTRQLKPYFQLESCVDAVFSLAGKLYGLTFRQRNDIPVYHPEVRTFEVRDEDGSHLGVLYMDFFPRKGKRGGAWMTEFRGQYREGDKDVRPLVSIVTNFTKPAGDSPSLLTHDELTTLLHEFGHALHGLLSRGRYPSLSGTHVARDFVELPSQLMENWAFEPEFLQGFARHYLTGETLPASLVERLVRARNYLAAYGQVRQLQFGLVDMAWHTLESLPDETAVDFENRVLCPYRTLPVVEGTAQCPTFGHIFSGGYSAGYYSYKWAEVLEADAFEAFREHGIFDRVTAASFRKNILERGSSEDEMDLYVSFRGHAPEPEALLRKLGIS